MPRKCDDFATNSRRPNYCTRLGHRTSHLQCNHQVSSPSQLTDHADDMASFAKTLTILQASTPQTIIIIMLHIQAIASTPQICLTAAVFDARLPACQLPAAGAPAHRVRVIAVMRCAFAVTLAAALAAAAALRLLGCWSCSCSCSCWALAWQHWWTLDLSRHAVGGRQQHSVHDSITTGMGTWEV